MRNVGSPWTCGHRAIFALPKLSHCENQVCREQNQCAPMPHYVHTCSHSLHRPSLNTATLGEEIRAGVLH